MKNGSVRYATISSVLAGLLVASTVSYGAQFHGPNPPPDGEDGTGFAQFHGPNPPPDGEDGTGFGQFHGPNPPPDGEDGVGLV